MMRVQDASPENPPDPAALALQALAWVLDDPDRAARLLGVTGLTPSGLRTRLDQPVVLAAILAFLEAYEPDLVACAAALEVPPQALVAARERLEQP
jgi:hypothetical protein